MWPEWAHIQLVFLKMLILDAMTSFLVSGVEHLCYGSCKAVEHIGQGLCNVLDIAVGALRIAEKACGWINAAIQFLMEMFLVHGYVYLTTVPSRSIPSRLCFLAICDLFFCIWRVIIVRVIYTETSKTVMPIYILSAWMPTATSQSFFSKYIFKNAKLRSRTKIVFFSK